MDDKEYDDSNGSDNKMSIKDYAIAINQYVDALKSNPVVQTPTIIPQVRDRVLSLDDKVDREMETLKDIENTHYEIIRYLQVNNASPQKKFWLNIKYGLGRHIPQLRETDASLAELLLLQSSNLFRVYGKLEGITGQYDSLADKLEEYEEVIYDKTEMLAERKDNLMSRIAETQEVLKQHISSKQENPSEKERNSYLMTKNRLSRALTDMDQELQLTNQQYVLLVDRRDTMYEMVNHMKEQSGLCKKTAVLGMSMAEFLQQTAKIHDTANEMHITTGELIEKLGKTTTLVHELARAREDRQRLTIEKIKGYIGDGDDGSEYRKMLEAPTREARELSKMMNKANEDKIKKRYELE